MYEELIKSLRICAIAERDYECAGCAYRDKDFDCNSVMKIEAADAIEKLVLELDKASFSDGKTNKEEKE